MIEDQDLRTRLLAVLEDSDLTPSPSLTRPFPTPSTTPTSDSVAMMTMMKEIVTSLQETFQAAIREIREMVVDMTQGRQQQTNGQQVMQPMPFDLPTTYDPDSTPLPPGIEAILQRESTETQQQRLLKERAELMGRLNDLNEQQSHLELVNGQDSGPWTQNLESPIPS